MEQSFRTQRAAGTEAPRREDSTEAGVAGAEQARGEEEGERPEAEPRSSDDTGL